MKSLNWIIFGIFVFFQSTGNAAQVQSKEDKKQNEIACKRIVQTMNKDKNWLKQKQLIQKCKKCMKKGGDSHKCLYGYSQGD